jgi:hypothetical protein
MLSTAEGTGFMPLHWKMCLLAWQSGQRGDGRRVRHPNSSRVPSDPGGPLETTTCIDIMQIGVALS